MSSDFTAVPTHPGLLVRANGKGDDPVWITYIADADVLIAADLATADILAPRKKPGARRGPRPRRVSLEEYRVDRHWVVRDGVPIRRCRLFMDRIREDALRLPGVAAALEAADQREAERKATEAEWAHRDLMAA